MAPTVEFLCDTSVLIDYLRGDEKVREFLQVDRFGRMSMSSVTLMELVVGAFNKQEVRKIRNGCLAPSVCTPQMEDRKKQGYI